MFSNIALAAQRAALENARDGSMPSHILSQEAINLRRKAEEQVARREARKASRPKRDAERRSRQLARSQAGPVGLTVGSGWRA